MSEELHFTEQDLRRFTGEGGTRMYIACGGVVYDVTECARWRSGLHENMHFPGLNLTEEFADAPHGIEVFAHRCVQRVGILASQ